MFSVRVWGPGPSLPVSRDALVRPVGSVIRACALRACLNCVLSAPKCTCFSHPCYLGILQGQPQARSPRSAWVLSSPGQRTPFTEMVSYYLFNHSFSSVFSFGIRMAHRLDFPPSLTIFTLFSRDFPVFVVLWFLPLGLHLVASIWYPHQ